MTKKLTAILLATLCCLQAPAQTIEDNGITRAKQKVNISRLYEDLQFSVGFMAPITQHSSDYAAEAIYELSYGHYNLKGFGFKAGVNYMPEFADCTGIVGVPIAFAYRTNLFGYEDMLINGLEGMVGTAVRNPRATANDPRNLLTSFLTGIVSRYEFFAGVTPDYITGDKDWPDANRFGLTADLGIRFSYRIWRFCLNITPTFHYRFTNNLCTYRYPGPGYEFQPVRGMFSLSAGLSFML